MSGIVTIREADMKGEIASLLGWAAKIFAARAPLNPSEVLARDCMLAGALRPAAIAIRCRHTVRRDFLPIAARIDKVFADTGVDLFLYGDPGKCSHCTNSALKTLDDRFVCFFCLERAANEYDTGRGRT